MTEAKQKWITWLKEQVGTREIGDNVVHKYFDATWDNQLYGFEMNGNPWCDAFADYSYIAVFGYSLGTRMTYQQNGGSAACVISAGYYQQNNAFYTSPEIGDQIFFYVSGGINHTGLVINVDENHVYTIEGNSSDSVRQNTYYRYDNSIAGYGRPNWALVEETDSTTESQDSTTDSTNSTTDIPTDSTIKSGDWVRVKSNAVWYTGSSIPSFVFNCNWLVHSVYGDRAVINSDESFTHQIMSPINVKYLEPVSEVVQSEVQASSVIDVTTYTVKRGDTLWAIARTYLGNGSRYPEIKSINNLTSDIIHVGQVLIIPKGEN